MMIPVKKSSPSLLFHLVYMLRFNKERFLQVSNRNELKKTIWDSEHPEHRGLTGTYCYGNNQLFHCIEGTKEQLDSIKNDLLQNAAHLEVYILEFVKVSRRQFSKMHATIVEEHLLYSSRLGDLHPFEPLKWPANEWRRILGRLYAHHNKQPAIVERQGMKMLNDEISIHPRSASSMKQVLHQSIDTFSALQLIKFWEQHQAFIFLQTFIVGLMITSIVLML